MRVDAQLADDGVDVGTPVAVGDELLRGHPEDRGAHVLCFLGLEVALVRREHRKVLVQPRPDLRQRQVAFLQFDDLAQQTLMVFREEGAARSRLLWRGEEALTHVVLDGASGKTGFPLQVGRCEC